MHMIFCKSEFYYSLQKQRGKVAGSSSLFIFLLKPYRDHVTVAKLLSILSFFWTEPKNSFYFMKYLKFVKMEDVFLPFS